MAHRDIAFGTAYPEAIVKAINDCDALLVVHSAQSGGSQHVRNEIERAFNARKPIFVVRTDAADPGTDNRISYFLASTQWFDADAPQPDEYLPRLVASVRALLDGVSSRAVAPDTPDQAANELFEAAAALEHSGKWEEADRKYRRILNSPSERVRCHSRIRLARCLLETCNRGETDEAEELLVEAAQCSILRNEPVLQGQLLLQQGRLDDLNARVKYALDRYEQARSALEESGADLGEVDLVLASAERRRGEFNKSLARLKALKPEELPKWLEAEYYDELGATLLARGEARDAIVVLEKGLALDNATGSAYTSGRSKLLLAHALMSTGSLDDASELIEDAIDAYKSAEESTAGLSEAYAVLGSWYEEREDYWGAIHAYLDSYEYDRTSGDEPGMIRAKRRLASAYRKLGNTKRAYEALDEARAHLASDDDVERAGILREEGYLAICGSDPNYDKAIRHFKDGLAIATDDGDERTIALAKRDLAAAYRADDNFPEAERLLVEAQEALEERGDLHELDDLLDDLGELKLEWDKYEEAEKHLLKSLELDNKLGRVASKARSLLLLGRVASRTLDQDLAGERFQEACDLYKKARNEVGYADALQALAGWQLTQGQTNTAVSSLQEALELEHRLDRRLGRVQVKRLLAAAMRERGNVERARELLTEARNEFKGIDDPVEHALLDVEEGRLELIEGDQPAARSLLDAARRVLEENSSPVDAAVCGRYLALAAAHEGRYEEALALLESARAVFVARNDYLELDEVHDDLATVHLMRGDFELAEKSVQNSLDVGKTGTWKRGNGRSLILLAKISEARRTQVATKRHLDEALELFKRIGDEVGQATALVELGDWYASEGKPGPDLSDDLAVAAYKEARRLLQHHRNRRGVARCNRKLALVYLDRGEVSRADETLGDARAELSGTDDPRDFAPLELACGKLASARNDHLKAIDHLRQALDGFTLLGQDHRRTETHRLLAGSFQAQGDIRSALDCVRQMETERVSMYTVLVDELDDSLASACASTFASGSFASAVDLAFGELERTFRRSASELRTGVPASAPLAEHIAAWAENVPVGSDSRVTRAEAETFARFCISTFEVLRSPAHRRIADRPGEAFAGLSIAHWIAHTLANIYAEPALTEPAADAV
jgi:tetratricopeptide (TPR) repeat protein